jgi:hypothetical protein
LPVVWLDPKTDVRLNKRIVRLVIEEIVVDVTPEPPVVTLVIHWKGGDPEWLSFPDPVAQYGAAADTY